jgi:hypothetical protein
MVKEKYLQISRKKYRRPGAAAADGRDRDRKLEPVS